MGDLRLSHRQWTDLKNGLALPWRIGAYSKNVTSACRHDDDRQTGSLPLCVEVCEIGGLQLCPTRHHKDRVTPGIRARVISRPVGAVSAACIAIAAAIMEALTSPMSQREFHLGRRADHLLPHRLGLLQMVNWADGRQNRRTVHAVAGSRPTGGRGDHRYERRAA